MKPLTRIVAPPPTFRIPADVEDSLLRVETRLLEQLRANEPRLEAVAGHLVKAGGKRIRPLVVMLVFHAAGGSDVRRDDAIEAAVALELIHSATLLHDDIIDDGETRRGQPSALKTFGLADTLIAGDFLFSRAFALCARFETEVIRWAADACISLTEGEIMQGRFRHNPSVTPADYADIIERKTASLFAAGGRTAAHLAGAPGTVVETMASCGRQIGLAFQVTDDLLDVVGESALTGKPRGIDLRDGNPSMPIVLAMQRDSALREVFAKRQSPVADIEAGVARIRRTGVLEEVSRCAEAHANSALNAIATLPPSDCRDALDRLTRGLIDRRL